MIDGFYPELANGTIRLANKLKIPVVMDSGSWKSGMCELLVHVDYLIVSTSFKPPKCNSLNDTLLFLEQFKFKGVAITSGKDEVLAYQNNKESKLYPTKVECVDSLGAGDILHGAFCFNFAKSGDFLSSLEYGMSIASTSCEFKGPHEWIKHI
jgi:sugar/nucleoside kinase (ribokinase family)